MNATARKLLSALLLAAFSTGCAMLQPADGKPAPIEIKLQASERLNPDERGESLPTSVVIYQLSSASKVESLELTELLREPKELLGDALLAQDEMLVMPGSTETKLFERQKDAAVVVVAALVRRPTGTSWREIVPLPTGSRIARLGFQLEEYRVTRR